MTGILNARILASVAMLVFVGAAIAASTGAFFSDTETSTGNTFTAGAIDLTVDSQAWYNGEEVGELTWGQGDGPGLNITSEKFFDFDDVKPGDHGTTTVSLHVASNNAYLCAAITNLVDSENGLTEPEEDVDATPDAGELSQALRFTVWHDIDGDGAFDEGETILASGAPVNGGVYTLFDSMTPGPLLANSTTYIGVAWTLPAETGNIVQTDSLIGDVSFYAVQERNNGTFTCNDELLSGGLVEQDFGVMNQSGVLGYTAGFGLTDGKTAVNIQSVVVKLYRDNQLLQTNVGTGKLSLDYPTATQFSGPFDVGEGFNYAADGYWTNTREAEYGLTVVPNKVVATVVYDNGKVVTATNTNLTGDTSIIIVP